MLVDKIRRLVLPYLFTMAIVVCAKLFLPSSMAYNASAGGGVKSMIMNCLLYGGDRWFVYVLFIITIIVLPFRKLKCRKWILGALLCLSVALYLLNVLPSLFALKKVAMYMVFFIVGMSFKDKYAAVKRYALKYWPVCIGLFLVLNVFLIGWTAKFTIVYRYVLPFTGSLAVIAISCLMDRNEPASVVLKYVAYVGKYSLQFYLFTFAYPIIRVLLVSKMQVTNPFVIIPVVFVLQLICTTIIVEITRRIPFLKVPCGY